MCSAAAPPVEAPADMAGMAKEPKGGSTFEPLPGLSYPGYVHFATTISRLPRCGIRSRDPFVTGVATGLVSPIQCQFVS